MANYIDVLGKCFPEAQAYISGGKDPSVYENLTWITTPIPKETLDTSPCGINPLAPVDINTAHPEYPIYAAGSNANFYYGLIPFKAGTSRFTDPNAAPPVTEGTEIWSFDLTPVSPTSVFTVFSSFQVDTSKSATVVVAVFRNNECIGCSTRYCGGGDKPGSMTVMFADRPETSSQITYSARIGTLDSSGSWYINKSKSYTLGDTMQQHFIITENE